MTGSGINILSLLSFFACILCLYFGLHTIWREPHAALSRIFFIYCLTGAVWALGYVFIYPSTDIGTIWTWYRFTAFGWCFIHSSLLHFVLILTGKKNLLARPWIYVILYFPSVLLVYRSTTSILIAENFYNTPWGNAEILATQSIWFNIYGLYNISYLIIVCVILWRWSKKSGIARYKKQAHIVIGTTLVSFIMASLCNMILPSMEIHFPSVGALFSISVIGGAWWAMARYKFMVLTPEIAAGEIISKMMDIMILSYPDGRIIAVNKQAEDLLGYSAGEFRNKFIPDILDEKDEFEKNINSSNAFSGAECRFEGNLITRKNERIPVIFYCSDVKDTSGDVAGIVLVAHDQRNTIDLKAALEKIQETNRELVKTRDELWGEMQLAKKIQTMLLPAKPSIPGYMISAFMEPASEVGGDYYDIINSNGKDWLIIGDVSGHGVPSGLIMMMTQTAIHTIIQQHPDIIPSELLSAVDGTISQNIMKMSEDKYMTINAFLIHENGRLQFSGLHQDILIYRAQCGAVEILESKGIWLGFKGILVDKKEEGFIDLEIGDSMLVYTDGITESWEKNSAVGTNNIESKMFGSDRLVDLFGKSAPLETASVISSILNELKEYDWHDDITMVVIKRVS